MVKNLILFHLRANLWENHAKWSKVKVVISRKEMVYLKDLPIRLLHANFFRQKIQDGRSVGTCWFPPVFAKCGSDFHWKLEHFDVIYIPLHAMNTNFDNNSQKNDVWVVKFDDFVYNPQYSSFGTLSWDFGTFPNFTNC